LINVLVLFHFFFFFWGRLWCRYVAQLGLKLMILLFSLLSAEIIDVKPCTWLGCLFFSVSCILQIMLSVIYFFFLLIIFYFIFEWSYINNMRGFHCHYIIHVYSVPWQGQPLHYIPISFFLFAPFAKSVWWVSLCCLHVHVSSLLPSS
jgi:hypothetical protein